VGKAKGPKGFGVHKKKRQTVMGLLCGSEWQFYAPVKGHSEKPLTLYDWARAKLKGPYLELWARNDLYGWDNWGHELGYHLSERGVEKLKKVRLRKKVKK